MKGFFIPLDFGKLKLTQIEEKLLATYRYYTLLKNGYHHCALTNKKLAEMLYVNERSIKRAKKRLKDLGYIKTNGGTLYTFTSASKDLTKVATNSSKYKFRFSHFACLNLPYMMSGFPTLTNHTCDVKQTKRNEQFAL